MGNVSIITVNDSNAVSHDFTPVRVGETLVQYADKSVSAYGEQPTLAIGNRLPTQANGNYKATVRLRVPIPGATQTNADGSNFQKAMTVNCDFVIPSEATAEQRTDLAVYVQYLAAHTAIAGLVSDMDLPY